MFTLEVKEVSALMPMFLSLGNKDLKPRHMKKIFELLNSGFNSTKSYSFQDLINGGAMNKKD